MNRTSFINTRDFGYFILFVAFTFFFYHITNIDKNYFDETHYVPAARQWQQMAPITNTEHPPLGKFLIAGGMDFFGDNPIGWRAGPVVAGSFAILLCYLISLIVFNDFILSVSVALFSLFNFWFYIQSRIAMLDIFMVTFFLAGIYYFLKYKFESNHKIHFYLSAIFWGMSVAIKWSAIFIYLPFFIIAFVSESKRPSSKAVFSNYFFFGLISIVIYYVTFLPYMFVTSPEKRSLFQIIFTFPLEMLEKQRTVGGQHPYSSQWYSWPLILRPIWYEFSQSADKLSFKGVVLLANPWQMALGILAVFSLALRWPKTQLLSKMTLILFLCSWLAWAIAPRKISFFYYFFPSAVFYSFLIPMALREALEQKMARNIMITITIISFGFFYYFFPILSGTSAPESIRGQWYWLSSWI